MLQSSDAELNNNQAAKAVNKQLMRAAAANKSARQVQEEEEQAAQQAEDEAEADAQKLRAASYGGKVELTRAQKMLLLRTNAGKEDTDSVILEAKLSAARDVSTVKRDRKVAELNRIKVREHSSAVERCGPTLPSSLPCYGPLTEPHQGALGGHGPGLQNQGEGTCSLLMRASHTEQHAPACLHISFPGHDPVL